MYVKKRLKNAKINKLQLDLFGFCNAKCWYCPVKYIPQPEEGKAMMEIELVEKIFREFTEEKQKEDGIVDPEFNLFLTTHYSEILLYPHFEELLKVARKYRFQTFILSNGVNLTPDKVDIIRCYPDVVVHIGLNVPAFDAETWSKRAGFPEKRFWDLIDNLKYAETALSYLRDSLQIHVNGVDAYSFGGDMEKGPDFDKLGIDLDPMHGEHQRQVMAAEKMFPGFTVTKNGLMDRGGMITNVLNNQPFMERALKNKQVVGCGNWGDRTTEWLHVNSRGDCILCCNDYNFDYIFGNIKENSLTEIWGSEKHIETIERAYENICTKCTCAVVI